MTVRSLFATQLYEAALAEDRSAASFGAELEAAILMVAQEDRAGRAWCRANGYRGYTSYASLDDLPRRASVFADLKRRLDRHVATFADSLAFDLKGGRLKLDSLWVNVLKPRATHAGHIHPHSVVSGTHYVRTPAGCGEIRFEDPRLAMMMAAPPRHADADEAARSFVSVRPQAGRLLLWESWLRHEVGVNGGAQSRISVSFNYAWG